MVHRVVLWLSDMLGRRLAAALTSNLVSELEVLLLGCPYAAFCCRRGVCHLCHLGSRLQPCRVLCRRRSCAWGVFSFCQTLCPRCGSRSRALSVLSGSLIRSAWNLLRLPNYWLALAA